MRYASSPALWRAMALLAGLSTYPASAQDVLKPFRADDGTPVMRARPVSPPQPLPANPIETTPSSAPKKATPTPKTLPVRRAKPVKGLDPNAPSKPVSTPLPAVPEPADPGEIRMTPAAGPKSLEQSQIEIADSYYARKMYDMAAPEYQRYIDEYPGGESYAAALFRLAESYRRSGSFNAAKSAYEQLLSHVIVGEFVGPASYRLADLYYQQHDYSSALPYYRKAAVRLKEPAVINAAKFYGGRCLEAIGGAGNKMEASEVYRELADTRDSNPFREASRLSLALLLKDAKRTADAVKNIQILAKETENPDLKVEATVRGGVWELELQQYAKAAEDLRKALDMPNIGRWRETADVGLMRLYYDTGKYKQVLEAYAASGNQFSPEVKPEVLLLVANSTRQLSGPAEALPIYDQVIKDFPGTIYASDAAYQRLVTLYKVDDPKLGAEIESFLGSTPDPEKRDEVLLMKAEALYKKADYAAAAPVYRAVALSQQLTGILKAEALFKLGWCSIQTHEFDHAVDAFTRFLDGYPTNKLLCEAYVYRGVAHQSTKNFAAAEKDYTEVIKRYPKCKERELALEQKALIRGQQNDNAGMVENFTLLLRDYPNSTAAGKAHFNIGRSAYEAKEYKTAAEHLSKARQLDKEQYFERASLPLLYCYYYLEDTVNESREVDAYRTDGKGKVPMEILRWLADQLFDSSSYVNAEKDLQLLSERDDVAPKDLLKLGQTRLKLDRYADAVTALNRYLESVKEPISRALGFVELAKAHIGAGDLDAAQKAVDEALTLQPEGKLNAEARIAAGDIAAARGDFDLAAKLYSAVAPNLDDEEITPRALERAVEAYTKAGKDAEAKKTLNLLKSRYPEYLQRKKPVK